MKKSFLKIFGGLLAIMLFSGCTSGALTASSWPGISAASGNVYIASGTRVMAVQISNGALVWQYPAEPSNKQTFYASPAIGETQIIIGDYTNNLFSLDLQTGNQQWVFSEAKGRFIGGALIDGDSIYAPSTDNYLYALNLQGNLRWKFETGNALWAKPVSDNNNVYLASMDHSLYAINKESGKEVWSVDFGGAMVSSPLLTPQGMIYVGTLAEEIVAVESATGKILWRSSTSKPVWSTPTLKEDTLYFSDTNGIIYAINAIDGAPLWQLETGSTIIASAAQFTDGLFFTTQAGDLLAVSYDGNKLWTRTIGGELFSTPLVVDDSLIIAVMGGENLLVCLNTNGNQRWTFQPPK